MTFLERGLGRAPESISAAACSGENGCGLGEVPDGPLTPLNVGGGGSSRLRPGVRSRNDGVVGGFFGGMSGGGARGSALGAAVAVDVWGVGIGAACGSAEEGGDECSEGAVVGEGVLGDPLETGSICMGVDDDSIGLSVLMARSSDSFGSLRGGSSPFVSSHLRFRSSADRSRNIHFIMRFLRDRGGGRSGDVTVGFLYHQAVSSSSVWMAMST